MCRLRNNYVPTNFMAEASFNIQKTVGVLSYSEQVTASSYFGVLSKRVVLGRNIQVRVGDVSISFGL